MKKKINKTMVVFFSECPIGFFWENCSKPCPYPLFGAKCHQTCICTQELCDTVNGCKQGKCNCASKDIFLIYQNTFLFSLIVCL